MECKNPVWSYDYLGERDAIHCDHGMIIPIDPANRHYAEIMRQVADEGLVIAEPDDIVFPEEPS
jgi:hypothetical protein